LADPNTRNTMRGSYGIPETQYLADCIQKNRQYTAGKVGVVLGSERPWVEILVVSPHVGAAAEVWTLEYGRIDTDHPQFVPKLPTEFAQALMAHQTTACPRSATFCGKFDFAVTFSSLEHSGLGRYGDELNPYGDLEAMAQTWCALKPGGVFLLGLPSEQAGTLQDKLVFNAHRFYGPLRLAQMFANYEYVESYRPTGSPQASIIHVLRKPLISGA
jgi:hypothetical protein